MPKNIKMQIQYNPYRLFSYNFTRLLRARGMTQNQAAEKFGICAAATVNLWANGHRLPSAESLSRIAEVLNVPIAELFFDPETTPTGLPGVDTNTPVLATTDDDIKHIVNRYVQRNPVQPFAISISQSYALKFPFFNSDDVLICRSSSLLSAGRAALYEDEDGSALAMRVGSVHGGMMLYPVHPCYGIKCIQLDSQTQSHLLCMIDSIKRAL